MENLGNEGSSNTLNNMKKQWSNLLFFQTRKEHELSECIAPGNTAGECFGLTARFNQGANVDYTDMNCLERFGFPNVPYSG